MMLQKSILEYPNVQFPTGTITEKLTKTAKTWELTRQTDKHTYRWIVTHLQESTMDKQKDKQ